MRAPLSMLMALALPAGFAGAQTPAAAPPSVPAAMVPVAMMRSKPKVDEIRLEVELFQQAPVDPNTGTVIVNGQAFGSNNIKTSPTYNGAGVSVAIPVLVRTSWCDTDFTKSVASAFVDGLEQVQDPAKCFVRMPGTAEALLRFDARFIRGACESVTFKASYQVQRWELQVDERLASTATWPREWPSGMDRFLKAEFGINPAIPAVKACAEGATKGGPRSVTPFVAAKYAVHAIVSRWRVNSSTTSIFGQRGALRGVNFTDLNQPWGLEAGGGTPIELAATCVAGLRAINIPSRIVFCLVEGNDNNRGNARGSIRSNANHFRFICEFFIPNVGWIPFDPLIIRQQSTIDPVKNAIKGFASVPDLERTLPLAYRLVPEGYEKADRFALWGWKGGLGVDEARAVSRIGFDASGRGNGKIPTMPAPVSDEAP
jgi:hypothetical protein